MKAFRTLLVITFLVLLNTAMAQEYSISGLLVNSMDETPLVGASVKLVSQRDTLDVINSSSGTQGEFVFKGLSRGAFRLVISYIGFEKVEKIVAVGGKNKDLGIISIAPSATNLNAIDVNAASIRAEQKGDTTQYNASAFKVTQDASTEDLIKKMPGITVENGTVKAHGEDVKKVLVDGKQFFGDDPSVTLKNLPAEVVDKIQVFDKLSDQAAWTGFDDGSGQKTINIVTRNAKNTGKFGKFSAGYGTDERYLLGANMNIFDEQRRITFLVMSNNVNQQNFSAEDLVGSSSSGRQQGMPGGRSGMGGGGGQGFQVGPQSGIFSTNAIGFNYTNSWGSKLTLNASYFLNNGTNKTDKLLNREDFLTEDSSQYYNETSSSDTKNTNHRINMRIEYNPDTSNSFILTPRLSLQDNNSGSLSGAITATDQEFNAQYLLNSSTNDNSSIAQGYNFNNELLYRHKFSKKGRTVSLNLGTGVNNRSKDNSVNTGIYYRIQNIQTNDSVNQQGKTLSDGYSISSNIVYTEPIGKKSQLQLNYNISYAKSNIDKQTNNYDFSLQQYNLLDTALSNTYDNDYITHRIGTGYLLQTEKMNLNTGITFQYATLSGNTTFPYNDSTDKTFNSVLPNLMFNYKFSKLTNLRIVYRVNTNAPSSSQLQKVLDNSNSVLLTTGNPDLKQEIRHFAMSRFSHSNKDKTANLFGMLFFQKTVDYIGNSSFLARNDTLVNEQIIKRGTQLSIPMNLDGAWNTRALITIGFPVKPIKCNINFNTGLSYNHQPSIINLLTNVSNTYGFNLGTVLSSNISEKIDFTVTYNFNYNLVDNTIQPDLNNNYYFQIGSLQFNWEFWKGFFIQNSMTFQNYNGISSRISSQYTLWNLNVGKKLFKNKAGEIKLSGYDLLDENKSLNRSVTETYIEDSDTKVLRQYFQLSFTYNLRNFNGKVPSMEERHGHGPGFEGRPDFHMH